MEKCTICQRAVWPGQKLVRTDAGKAHRKCQRHRVQDSETVLKANPADYLSVSEAAGLKGISREAVRQILRRGDLPGYCELCLRHLPVEMLRSNAPVPHKNCPGASGQARANVVLRRKDVEEYEVMASRQAAGRLGGLARKA